MTEKEISIILGVEPKQESELQDKCSKCHPLKGYHSDSCKYSWRWSYGKRRCNFLFDNEQKSSKQGDN